MFTLKFASKPFEVLSRLQRRSAAAETTKEKFHKLLLMWAALESAAAQSVSLDPRETEQHEPNTQDKPEGPTRRLP